MLPHVQRLYYLITYFINEQSRVSNVPIPFSVLLQKVLGAGFNLVDSKWLKFWLIDHGFEDIDFES